MKPVNDHHCSRTKDGCYKVEFTCGCGYIFFADTGCTVWSRRLCKPWCKKRAWRKHCERVSDTAHQENHKANKGAMERYRQRQALAVSANQTEDTELAGAATSNGDAKTYF